MQHKIPKHLKRAVEVKSDAGRTDLYRWLKARHAALTELLAEAKPGWATLAMAIDKEGVKGRQGQVISADAVRRIWRRLCRDLEVEERVRLAGGTTKRSPTPAPKGWTPPVVAKPTTFQTQPAPFAPSPTSPARADPSQMTPAERKADLMRVIDKRSGR